MSNTRCPRPKESFSSGYLAKSNLQVRALDCTLHLLCGYGLVFLFHEHLRIILLQFFPDAMLLLLWPYSMLTGRYVWYGNPILRIHRMLHSFTYFALMLIFLSIAVSDSFRLWKPVAFVLLNWFVHITIDLFTHKEEV